MVKTSSRLVMKSGLGYNLGIFLVNHHVILGFWGFASRMLRFRSCMLVYMEYPSNGITPFQLQRDDSGPVDKKIFKIS